MKGEDELVSIIIPVFNQLHLTRNCLASIKQFTDESYEIILVNNGSKDKTKAVFDKLNNIKFINNKNNEGFAKACNQGIRLARGSLILLLNNDTIVSKNWLSNMVKCINSEPNIGMVGPTSNYVAGLQQVKGPSLKHYKLYNNNANKLNPAKWFDADFLSGFCLLIKREVIEKIGLLDEQFKFGTYEDNDYCLRVQQGGYKLVVAGDTFIYHLGSQTFKRNRMNDSKIVSTNEKLFNQKWNLK